MFSWPPDDHRAADDTARRHILDAAAADDRPDRAPAGRHHLGASVQHRAARDAAARDDVGRAGPPSGWRSSAAGGDIGRSTLLTAALVTPCRRRSRSRRSSGPPPPCRRPRRSPGRRSTPRRSTPMPPDAMKSTLPLPTVVMTARARDRRPRRRSVSCALVRRRCEPLRRRRGTWSRPEAVPPDWM